MTDNRNTILAVILSGLVLLGWQYFFNIPQMEKQRALQQAAQSEIVKPAPDAGVTRFQRLPLEAMERRAEIVEHGRKVAVQGRTTAD